MDATADVLELRQIRAGLGIGDVSTVDLPAQTACDDHGLLGFVCGELLHEKEGRGVVRAQPFGLDVHLGFHGRMLVRGCDNNGCAEPATEKRVHLPEVSAILEG